MVKGVVILFDGFELSYIFLVSIVVEVELVWFVEFCQFLEWCIFGKFYGWIDMVLKCMGILEYGIDFEIENMVYVMV